MTDRPRDRHRPLPPGQEPEVLTAAAQMLHGTARETYAITYRSWQDELWAYTASVGEYGSVLNWYASGISRMHLRAGVWRPGMVEPETLTDGRAAELVNELVVHAKGGETQFLSQWAKHLFVPGVGFFLGEEVKGVKTFTVKSADVIKRSTQEGRDPVTGERIELYDIRIAPDKWRTTSINSLVGRIFHPDPRYDYLPTSISQGALTTLREIDLYNRHIVATLLSRIAFNGFLMIPQEVTFPVNPQFKDAPDPFIAELLHFASRGIKDPGSPGSAIPFPLRVPAQYIEYFQHLMVASGIDPKVIEARESAIRRLAEELPAPPEALSGIQDMNHWNAWKSSEDSVKMYFGPTMEILCGGLTELYLHPMMQVSNEPIYLPDGGKVVMWYDASDLTVQPDNSENADLAFNNGRLDSDEYLTAMGFNPDSAPSPDDAFREQVLMRSAMTGTPLSDGYFLLYPDDKPEEPPPAPEGGVPSQAAGPSKEGAPSTGTPAQEEPGAPA